MIPGSRYLDRIKCRCRTLPAISLLFYVLPCHAGPVPGPTTAQQIGDAARQFLEQSVLEYLDRSAITAARFEITAGRVDPRTQMPPCSPPLEVTLQTPSEPVGRVTTRVRCATDKPWTIYVPATVRLFRPIVIATRPLTRNQTLTANDVALAERDVGLYTQGYFTDTAQVAGLIVSRSLSPDQVIVPTFLTQPAAIKKGDQVVIVAGNDGINVRMPGEAMDKGAIGDQIRVRNRQSGRVVKARITAPGVVEVHL